MAKKELKYSEAIREIEDILQVLDAEEVEVDNVAQQIKRAVCLLGLCRSKLDKAEIEVQKISDTFEKPK